MEVTSHVSYQRWETDVRFYETIVETDLLGDRVLMVCWGGKRNRLGCTRVVAVGDEDVEAGLTRIAKERFQRGCRESSDTLDA